MARKFNIGRQGEQLLNPEWHNLFMSLKYLNYEYKNYPDDKIQPERQTDIPSNALRLHKDKGLDVLKTFYPSSGSGGEWRPLFENFYHPANSVKPDGNTFVDYRLCIDPLTGTIQYWDPDQQSWLVAQAYQYTGGNLNTFNGQNFQQISDLNKIQPGDFYPVPYVRYGRLFSKQQPEYTLDNTVPEVRGRFVSIIDYNPQTSEKEDQNYETVNDCAIVIKDESHDELSWVHVNASKVSSINKRLIEVPDDGYINITSAQTEFYGFKSDMKDTKGASKLGTLLLKGEKEEDLLKGYDFVNAMGGIQLSDEICKNKKYDFIYSITYIFDNSPSSEGYVTVGTGAVGKENSVYIGNRIEAPIALFLDGLSLEETTAALAELKEEEKVIYIHDPQEGTITFTDEEDAEIINNMQMAVLAFPNRTEEFDIGYNYPNTTIDIKNKTATIKVSGINDYKNIMVFCSGLGLQSTETYRDVTVNDDDTITIHNFELPYTPDENDGIEEPIKGFVADIGTSFVADGKLFDGKTKDYGKQISADKDYVIFVDGLLLTPTNGDMLIEDGYIELANTQDLVDKPVDYLILEIDNDDDEKLGLVFDETVSYSNIRINDDGDKAVYNDCNDAIVYIQNGIIIDQSAIEKPLNAIEGYYKKNQIIKIPQDDNGFSYKYYKYDFTQDEPEEITDQSKIDLIEYMIGYYSTKGSIHLLGKNKMWMGAAVSYYAYSYANMIDEPLSYGKKNNYPIYVKGFEDDNEEYLGKASRFDAWNMNCNSLSVYINGLFVESQEIDKDDKEEEEDGVARNFIVLDKPSIDLPTNKDYYGKNIELYHFLKEMYDKYVALKAQKEMEQNKNASLSFNAVLENEYVTEWILSKKTVRTYFKTELLAREALQLAIYIHEDMKNETISHIVERLERDEFMSAYRDFIYLESGTERDHSQIYKPINDTIEVDWALAPAIINVYHNGVLLQPSDYCKFNGNKIMFNTDICGLQQLPDIENMMKSIPDHVSEEIKYELETYSYHKKNVLRLIEDTAYYIPTSGRDTILIEKRDDLAIKTVSYDVLKISYETKEFTQDFYDIPDSLMNTADYVKIYINGVRYEGEYMLVRDGGIKGIRLTSSDALIRDPLYDYFSMHPKALKEYEDKYGEYIMKQDRITFEWR